MTEVSKPMTANHPHLLGFMEFLDDFNAETERGAALAAAAMIDDQLARTVRAFLIPNKGREDLLPAKYGILGSFEARSAAAFALGLISEREYKECDLIRRVRNEFAHQIKVSFKSDKIVGLCAQLQMSAKPYAGVSVDPRGQFTTAAVALILNLTNRPHYVGKEALRPREWKY